MIIAEARDSLRLRKFLEIGHDRMHRRNRFCSVSLFIATYSGRDRSAHQIRPSPWSQPTR